ncbi:MULTISPECIES: hypothetical protein [unclassified Exiguobacterium]|uniref:hypothetical protein n=1 Tax=unclassified Exiguobacterium TaxID=2644629 RepID=UPI0025B7E192|nr:MULTISPECIES: hypothetical protein [unclassified Exiguobacterium]
MRQRTVMTLLALSLLLTVCMLKKSTLTPKASTIDFTIAVVGTAPILTRSPDFHSIDLQEIKGDLRRYDAVMIMPEYLHQAAGRDYATVYRKAQIPFFLIGSQKSIEPFLDPSLSYEESISVPNPTFAAGMLYDDTQETTWLFGEGIERPNRSEQLKIYQSIFQTIEQSHLAK